MRTITPSLVLAALSLALPLAANSAAGPARAEIDALLDRLQASGCQFNRNGSWYTAEEAKTHLLRKLEYLEEKDASLTAERFIELGASASSSSGKAYFVKCGNLAEVDSRSWLTQELKTMRSAK